MAFRNYFSSNSDTTGDNGVETIKFEGRNLKLTKLIAEGGFSYVYFGDFGGQVVAVKKVLTPDTAAGEAVSGEIDLLGRLTHRNIVKLLGVKTSNVENYIIMEYCCPLPQSEGNEALVGNIFRQCCNAIEYMHNLGIAHRDVKLENFLVGADGFVKLVDFGSATREVIKPSIEWNATQRGIVEEKVAAKTTPMYRAPELLDLWQNHQIDTRVDLWALGCLLYLLNYGSHPFPDSNKLAIINAKYSLRIEDSFTPIIRGLLQPNPDDRITFQIIFDYVSDVTVTTIEFKKPVITPIPEAKREERSLFSSLRGGAESLFKNLKDNIREMTTEPTSPPQPTRNDMSPPKPQPSRALPPLSSPVPPRPPKPAPPLETSLGIYVPEESTNRNLIENPPITPVQSSGPSTGNEEETEGILLDFGDSQQPSSQFSTNSQNGHVQNVDLLADLFGGTSSAPPIPPQQSYPIPQLVTNEDIFGDFSVPVLNPAPTTSTTTTTITTTTTTAPPPKTTNLPKGRNFLDDLDLFGNDITTTLPSSSSFSSLAQLRPERIVKNVSTPNLTELGEKSTNPQPPPSPPQYTRPPNYSRAAFEPHTTNDGKEQKKNNLNDVFGEFLKSEGFNVSSNSKNQTIQEMRKQEMVTSGMDPISIKVNNWKEGKTKNIRALLSSLHTITWPDCNWQEISMAEMVTFAGVKKSYRKACLGIHPDKQVGSEHEVLAKAIFIELNEAWSAFEEGK